jgi:N-formylglutamate amidohydrolase
MPYTDELFPLTPFEAGRVVFPISRLICDVERFPSDENEPMAARGMGVFYIRTPSGEVLRAAPGPVVRQSLLDRWYWPHHSKLERMVNDVVARSGRCLIIDCFPYVALPYEIDQREERADFCIDPTMLRHIREAERGTDTPADCRSRSGLTAGSLVATASA